ncbi:hypothetical protein K523DRAFT_279760 [Schizophyllum commune Tattone D]|nr:hypothetical protein K523DRAFT_279760 [Schizophyllum commune Tattone D]
MGRWTQFDEDRYRLPEGFKRVAYDADTKRYTFLDANGDKYVGNPGEEYGHMTPVANLPEQPRPGAFSEEYTHRPMPSGSSANAASSFLDILPSNRIGSAPPPTDEKKASQQQRDKNLADVVETVMPKVQGVVQNLRRSITSARKGPPKYYGNQSSAGSRSSLDSKTSMRDSKTALLDAPPPYGDEKWAYSDQAWEAQKAQWGKKDEKGIFRSKSSASATQGKRGKADAAQVDRARSDASRKLEGAPQGASASSRSDTNLARTQSISSTISSLDYASDDSDYLERTRNLSLGDSRSVDRSQSMRSTNTMTSGVSDVSRATRMSVNDASPPTLPPRRSPILQ